MGLTVLRNQLYSVHDKTSDVYIHSTEHPFDRRGHPKIDQLKWPRGIAASQRHGYVFITDWYRMFRGRLWRATENITQVGFYRAMHFSAKRGYEIAYCPFVCLSVCNVQVP